MSYPKAHQRQSPHVRYGAYRGVAAPSAPPDRKRRRGAGGGCAITALALGATVLGGLARWKGVA